MSTTPFTPIPIPTEVALPPNSLILVTGIAGYIGAHIASELLKRGYRVRGIVRPTTNAAWMTPLFSNIYSSDSFSLFEVPALTEGALDSGAMDGVNGVIHLATDLTFSPDPNAVIPGAIELALVVLRAAVRSSSCTRFVLCSSSIAVFYPKANTPRTVTRDMFDTEAVERAWAPPPYHISRALIVYAASKTQVEQAVWEYVAEHPDETGDMVCNAVLPDINIGAPFSPENQGLPATSGYIGAFWKGDLGGSRAFIPVQSYVHVVDTALLHVAALLSPDVKSERLFGFAGPFDWNRVLDVFRSCIRRGCLPREMRRRGWI